MLQYAFYKKKKKTERLKECHVILYLQVETLYIFVSYFASYLKVDGGWSKWNSWSLCSKTVNGIQTRTRECSNPEPAFGGKYCNGTRAVVRECSNTSSKMTKISTCSSDRIVQNARKEFLDENSLLDD